MKNPVFKKWYQQLREELQRLSETERNPLMLMKSSLHKVRDCLDKLKIYIRDHPFEQEEEEIDFFKVVKPSFYSWQIYHTYRFTVETALPFEVEEQLHYLKGEMAYLERGLKEQQFLYQYRLLGANELDDIYFLRKAAGGHYLNAPYSDHDPEFSTAGDYLFSKFMAYEHLQEWIHAKLLYLMGRPQTDVEVNTEEIKKAKKLKPTTINLSVDQLGLLTRAADDARLLDGRSFNRICEELAPYVSTRLKQSISAGSLRSNAYLAENADKASVVKMLRKMIDFIQGY